MHKNSVMNLSVPLTDIEEQNKAMQEELEQAIAEVVKSGSCILGPEVKALEGEIAKLSMTKYGVGVASGTDAIKLALLACGVKTGDEVITTSFSFIATADSIVRAGATPVFADIDPATFNVDAEKIKQKITPKTSAIVVVHLYGQPARMDKIMDIAKEHGLKVVEDCAQAISADYQGQKVGSTSDAGCLSFFPSKNLGCLGDGGMVVTNDEKIAETVAILRVHGAKTKYNSETIGFNSRLDEIQAAVLRVKLKYLKEWTVNRQQAAASYNEHLKNSFIQTPYVQPKVGHVYNQYTVRSSKRDVLIEQLTKNGVASAVYYPIPIHLQDAFKAFGHKEGDLIETEKASQEVLSLPIFPTISAEQIKKVTSVIKGAF